MLTALFRSQLLPARNILNRRRIFFNKTIFSKNIKSDQNIPLAKEVSIEFLENNNSFSDQEWKELYKLSEETFVEETDSLKTKGAGAGLTDND